jgi:peroxiredoxin
MHLKIFLILFFFFPGFVSAPQVVITGIVPGGQAEEIRLMGYADQISFKPVILDRTMVSESGLFTLRTDEITDIRMAFMEIGFYSAVIVLSPDNNYEIIFDSVNFVDEFRPFYNKEPLNFQILEEPKPQLNYWLSEFENKYNGFIMENFESISKRRDPKILQRFRSELENEFTNVTNEFFKVYIDYKIATLELAAGPTRKANIFSQYLKNRSVYYNNPEYMFFFNTYFDQYLPGNNHFISRRDLTATINDAADYRALMDTLGKDSILRNEVIRELVLLKTMQGLYHDQQFNKVNVLSILNQVEALSKFPIHREIAWNLKDELTLLKPGFPAPDFELQNLEGGVVTLSDLSGKPVYLSFMNTISYGSLVEFERLKYLFETYGSKIHFVTVSFDSTREMIEAFRQRNQFLWLFLYNGSDYDLIHNYRIKTFPAFILINSDGTVAEYPAYKPSEIIEESFKTMIND